MKRPALLAVLAAAANLQTAALGAQERPGHTEALRPGSRVRFTVVPPVATNAHVDRLPESWQHAVVDSVSAARIWVHSPQVSMDVPVESLYLLQVHRGRRSAGQLASRGALLGALAVAVPAAVMYLVSPPKACDDEAGGCAEGLGYWPTAGLAVAGGSAAGAGLSLVLAPSLQDRWQAVRLPRGSVSFSVPTR